MIGRLLALVVLIGITYIIYIMFFKEITSSSDRTESKNKNSIKNIPTELTMLGLRIGGIINLKIGAKNFLLLNNTATVVADKTFIIDKLSVSKIEGALGVVRAYCGKYLFQFNIVDSVLNDILLFVVSETLPATRQYIEEFDSLEEGFKYKERTFDSSGYFSFQEHFFPEEVKDSREKLFIRDLCKEEETVEYALVKRSKETIVISTGLVVDKEEVEII